MLKAIWEWIVAIAIAIVLTLVLNVYVLQIAHVYGESMEPTFHNGDLLIVEKLTGHFGEYEIGDVIIVDHVLVDPEHKMSESIIKRIVAVAGDKVEVKDGILYRNDKKIDEKYIKETMVADMSAITVPEGSVYAMGDNRNNSSDSRVFGPFKLDDIRGRVAMEVYPHFFRHGF
jgi:signal peptidase I